jgi:hypothetical protein
MLASLMAIGISGSAWAGDRGLLTGPVTADSTLSLARYYSASIANIGRFPGTLVRLSCEANGGATPTEQSEQPQYDNALVLRGDDVMHPLVPGTDEVRRELSAAALRGAEVIAQGKYYPSTGAIFVSSLMIRNSGAAHDAATPEGQTGRLAGIRLARCATD